MHLAARAEGSGLTATAAKQQAASAKRAIADIDNHDSVLVRDQQQQAPGLCALAHALWHAASAAVATPRIP